MKDFFKHYVFPMSVLIGGNIGVGFLSLPYITNKVGIWLMLFYFVVVTGIVLCIHVIFGQISLKTPDFKRFPGFVGYHLGNNFKFIALVSIILGSIGILLAYLVIGSQFLWVILSPALGGSTFSYLIFYFAVLSFIVYFGIRSIAKLEFGAVLLLLISLLFIFIEGFSHIHIGNIFTTNSIFQIQNSFLPYGALLFALWGTGLIPEAEEMLKGNKRIFKKVIILSTLIVAIMYLLFTLLVLGITGSSTTESALIGVRNFLGDGAISFSLFIGVITTFTAFISQGLLLKKVFMYDMNMPHVPAWLITCFVPLLLFFLGFNSFIPLISFIGAVFLGIDGWLILMMYKKIGGKKIIIYPLTLVFVLGIVYGVVCFLK
jgi:tyrosine-specific transport protein